MEKQIKTALAKKHKFVEKNNKRLPKKAKKPQPPKLIGGEVRQSVAKQNC